MKLPLREFGDVITALKGIASGGGNEKRQAARMAVNAKIDAHLLVEGRIARSYSVLTRDISLTGLGLIQAIALPNGQEIILALPRKHPMQPLFVNAVVMHCRSLADGLMTVGLEFSTIAASAISEMLNGKDLEQHARLQRMVLQ